MPRFTPFAADRYAPGTDFAAVISPPYDVLSDADVAALHGRSPHNVTRADVPSGDDPYAAAAHLLQEWRAAGVIVADEAPSLTIYRMSFTDAQGRPRTIHGVLGGLEVVDEGAGGVLPHERTTPKATTDRLDLTRATAANLSPIWGLALAGGLTEALAEPGEEVGRLDDAGVTHVVERVSDPARIERIAAIIGADDVLIADGHHRYAVSRTYRDEVRGASGRDDTDAELTLAFVNELVADQLSIEAIHRVYTGLDAAELAQILGASFELSPAPEPTLDTLAEMVATGRLVLLTPDGAQWLRPRPEAFEGVRELDGALLEHALAGTPVDVAYQHGLDEVRALVSSGAASAAVLIRPTSLEEIRRTAREGLLMPPKSTFFTPKLKTGFVIRPTEPLQP